MGPQRAALLPRQGPVCCPGCCHFFALALPVLEVLPCRCTKGSQFRASCTASFGLRMGGAKVSARSDSISSANERNFVCRSEHLHLQIARALSANVPEMYLQRNSNSFANESMFICRLHVLSLQTYLTIVCSQ